MRLNIVIDEGDAAAVGERAEEAGITRPEWVRRAVCAALCRGLYRLGTLDVLEPVPAPCEDVQDIDDLHTQITGLQATIDRLMDECSAADAGRLEALQRAVDADKEIISLGRLLDERRDEINWLRGQIALLNERLPALLPERAGKRWWQFW